MKYEIDPLKLIIEPPCRHLLSKGMYITGERIPDKQRDGVGDGNCWCGHTQCIIGPDDQLVDRPRCSDTGRGCYQAVL
jgi:hypothetical protein